MREKRINIDCDQDDAGEHIRQRRILGDPTATAVLAVAAAATAALVSSSQGDMNDAVEVSPEESGKNDLQHESNVSESAWSIGIRRIGELGFQLCRKQEKTPMDGNCMFHAIASQSRFVSHIHARKEIVSNIYEMISNNLIFWDGSEYIR